MRPENNPIYPETSPSSSSSTFGLVHSKPRKSCCCASLSRSPRRAAAVRRSSSTNSEARSSVGAPASRFSGASDASSAAARGGGRRLGPCHACEKGVRTQRRQLARAATRRHVAAEERLHERDRVGRHVEELAHAVAVQLGRRAAEERSALVRRAAAVRLAPRQQLPHEKADAPPVDLLAVRRVEELGRAVAVRSGERAPPPPPRRVGGRGVRGGARGAKVSEHRVARRGDQHIVRLNIAVQQAALVEVAERNGDLRDQRAAAAERQRSLLTRERVRVAARCPSREEVAPVLVLHR